MGPSVRDTVRWTLRHGTGHFFAGSPVESGHPSASGSCTTFQTWGLSLRLSSRPDTGTQGGTLLPLSAVPRSTHSNGKNSVFEMIPRNGHQQKLHNTNSGPTVETRAKCQQEKIVGDGNDRNLISCSLQIGRITFRLFGDHQGRVCCYFGRVFGCTSQAKGIPRWWERFGRCSRFFSIATDVCRHWKPKSVLSIHSICSFMCLPWRRQHWACAGWTVSSWPGHLRGR